MKCQEASKWVHELLDGELQEPRLGQVEQHLANCRECAQLHLELGAVKNLIGTPQSLAEASSRQMWAELEHRRRGWGATLSDLLNGLQTVFMSLESRVMWARVSAVPLTLIGFLVLAAQFPRVSTQELTYPVYLVSTDQVDNAGSPTRPVMMQARQGRRELNGLIETVWRIPYEDSLSFVAAIEPGGHPRINDILEYPKNQTLLEAAAASLEDLQFEPSLDFTDTFLIYSIQKVDVYEGRGL